MKIIFLLACLLCTFAKAQYQSSLDLLEKAKNEIKKVEKKQKARANQIEENMDTDKMENETKEDDLTQKETKN